MFLFTLAGLNVVQVRRGAGVMATVRRVGRELSRRLYTLMTSTDPQLILRWYVAADFFLENKLNLILIFVTWMANVAFLFL